VPPQNEKRLIAKISHSSDGGDHGAVNIHNTRSRAARKRRASSEEDQGAKLSDRPQRRRQNDEDASQNSVIVALLPQGLYWHHLMTLTLKTAITSLPAGKLAVIMMIGVCNIAPHRCKTTGIRFESCLTMASTERRVKKATAVSSIEFKQTRRGAT
jgi:hypothetical protein